MGSLRRWGEVSSEPSRTKGAARWLGRARRNVQSKPGASGEPARIKAMEELLLRWPEWERDPFLPKPFEEREVEREGGRRMGGGLPVVNGQERIESSSSRARAE